MFFPIGDTQVKGGSRPLFSYTFIAINVLIFFFQFSLSPQNLNAFILTYGTIPDDIMHQQGYSTLFTNMFLHGGWMHLIGNMLFLWVFADNIEAVIGNFYFLLFYLLGGVSASLIHVYFNMGSTIPSIGASGAISAVLGAYIVMFPKSKIKVLVLMFFRSFQVAALYFLGFWIVQNLFSGFASLGANTADTAGVAWWAHIGGFAFGVLAGFFFKHVHPKNLNFSSVS